MVSAAVCLVWCSSLPGWCSSSASEPAFLWHLRLAKCTGHRLKTIKKQFASTDLFGAFPAWPFISAIHRVSTLHHLWGGGNYPWRIRPSITALETPGGSKIHVYIYISATSVIADVFLTESFSPAFLPSLQYVSIS